MPNKNISKLQYTNEIKVTKLTKEQAYCCIVEWLYQMDGFFGNKNEWRREFLMELSKRIKQIK